MKRFVKIHERMIDIEKIKNPKLKAKIASIYGINTASKGKNSEEGDKDHSYDDQYSDYDDQYSDYDDQYSDSIYDDDDYNCYRDGGY